MKASHRSLHVIHLMNLYRCCLLLPPESPELALCAQTIWQGFGAEPPTHDDCSGPPAIPIFTAYPSTSISPNQKISYALHSTLQPALKHSVSSVLTLCVMAGVATADVALAQDVANPEGGLEEKREKIHPLNHPAFQLLVSASNYATTDEETPAPWDDTFLNINHWDKLPPGRWRVESKADAVTKCVAEEIRSFHDGPTRLVRVRTETATGKIQSIEVIWAEIGLSVAASEKNFRRESRRETRNAMKQDVKDYTVNRETGLEFMDAAIAANHHLAADLKHSYGHPKPMSLGKQKDSPHQYSSTA
jgi:hypothetical protein